MANNIRVSESQLAINCGPGHELNEDLFIQVVTDPEAPEGGDMISIGIGTEIDFGYHEQYGVALNKAEATALVNFIQSWLEQPRQPIR